MHVSWARLASFCHLGFISDPLILSKFHNETHDPKGQENKIYTIVKGMETFYRRHTVPVTSCSEVKYVLKMVSFGSRDCTKELKLECANLCFDPKNYQGIILTFKVKVIWCSLCQSLAVEERADLLFFICLLSSCFYMSVCVSALVSLPRDAMGWSVF